MSKCLTNEESLKKQRIIVYSVLMAIAIALMAVGSFFDLEITKALYAPANFFGVALDVTGVSPFFLVIAFAGAVFFANCLLLPKTGFNIVKAILSAIACFAGLVLFFDQFTKIWLSSKLLRYLIAAAISVPFTLLVLWGFTKISEKNLKKLAIFALFSVIVTAVAMILMQGIKTVWGRPRFREMIKIDDFSAFTKWFIPYEISLEGDQQSFPSGHTASAGMIMVIAALPEVFDRLKKYEWLLFGLGLLFTICVALSRLIVGAHFLTDVVMGAVIAVSTYAIVRSLFFKRWKSAIKSIDN